MKYGSSSKLLKLLISMCSHLQSCVKVGHRITNFFETNVGLVRTIFSKRARHWKNCIFVFANKLWGYIRKDQILVADPNLVDYHFQWRLLLIVEILKNVKQCYIRTKNSQLTMRLNIIICLNHSSHMSQILAKEWQYQKWGFQLTISQLKPKDILIARDKAVCAVSAIKER